MNLSEERITHLSHIVLNTIKTKGGGHFPEEKKTLSGIKSAIHEFGEILDSIDQQIRQKIGSLKRNVPEGSMEWDVLYRQYFDEIMLKKGL